MKDGLRFVDSDNAYYGASRPIRKVARPSIPVQGHNLREPERQKPEISLFMD